MKKIILLLVFAFCSNFLIGQNVEKEEKKKSAPDLPGVILLDFGFNFFQKEPAEMNINWFKSKSFGLYYMRVFNLGKKISFNPAIGINFEKYGFSNDITIGYQDNGNGEELSIVDLGSFQEVSKSQLAMNYLDIPIQFRYFLKGNDVKGGTYFAIGGMLSLLVESHTKVKFTNNGRNQTQKARDDFNQSNLRYGVQGRFGFGSVNFFYKRYFSKLFNSEGPAGTADITTNTIGISISGL